MTNKEILKAMVNGCSVCQEGKSYRKIVDYSVDADKSGSFSYTAGCIDDDHRYQSVPCDRLMCDANLSNTKLEKPVWSSPYTPDTVLQVMKGKTPVTVNGICYRRISRLSTVIDRAARTLRYSATCEDEHRNTVTARIEQVVISQN